MSHHHHVHWYHKHLGEILYKWVHNYISQLASSQIDCYLTFIVLWWNYITDIIYFFSIWRWNWIEMNRLCCSITMRGLRYCRIYYISGQRNLQRMFFVQRRNIWIWVGIRKDYNWEWALFISNEAVQLPTGGRDIHRYTSVLLTRA